MGFFKDIIRTVAQPIAPVARVIPGADKVLGGGGISKQQPLPQVSPSAIRADYETGMKKGREEVEGLLGPRDQYKEALADIYKRRQQYADRGLGLAERQQLQARQAQTGRALRAAQASAGLRGGVAGAQRVAQTQQDIIQREREDELARQANLDKWATSTAARTQTLLGYPLARAAAEGQMQAAAQQAQIANAPRQKSEGLLGGLFTGLFGEGGGTARGAGMFGGGFWG